MLRVNTEDVKDSEITRNFDLLTIGTMTIFAGMPWITAENADEFYVRVCVVEGILGPFRDNGKRFTVEEARAFTGLRTNVTPFTPAKFISEVRRLMKSRLANLAEARERQD